MQEGILLAFIRKQLCEWHLGKSTYKKNGYFSSYGYLTSSLTWEMFLNWKLSSHPQILFEEQYFMPKETKMGYWNFNFDYEMVYKKGKENSITNSLCRKYEKEGSLFSLSFKLINWMMLVSSTGPKISNGMKQLH